jgi:hypothetical protein
MIELQLCGAIAPPTLAPVTNPYVLLKIVWNCSPLRPRIDKALGDHGLSALNLGTLSLIAGDQKCIHLRPIKPIIVPVEPILELPVDLSIDAGDSHGPRHLFTLSFSEVVAMNDAFELVRSLADPEVDPALAAKGPLLEGNTAVFDRTKHTGNCYSQLASDERISGCDLGAPRWRYPWTGSPARPRPFSERPPERGGPGLGHGPADK